MNELKTIMEHSSESQSVVDLNEPIDIDVNSMKAIYTSSPINPGEKIVRGVIEESSKINSTFVIEENMLDSIAVDASHEVINDPPYKSFLTSTRTFWEIRVEESFSKVFYPR